MSQPVSSATLSVDARCTLGEGPVWSVRRQALLWTDIEACRIWMFTPADGRSRSWRMPDRVGSFALCTSGRLLVALAKGLAYVDLEAHEGDGAVAPHWVCPVEAAEPRTRTNDGRTDRAGNFVFGTMNEAHGADGARIGRFYQYSNRHGLRPLSLEPIAIANSLCFSPDGGTLYFADSLARAIMQGHYEAETARVTGIRPFVQFGASDGLPDGSIVDAEGGVWNAAWGAGCVRRFTPDGHLDRTITMAAVNTTCPAFGGPALRDLFVTSSRQEMDAAALARLPHAGGLFHAVPGIVGLSDALFADEPA